MKLYRETNEKKNEFFKIETSFSQGGMNYATHKVNKKGVYVHFAKVIRENRAGYTTEQFGLFSSGTFKILMEEMNRKNQKRIDKAEERIYEIQDKLFELYAKDDKQGLLELIQGV